MGYTFPQSDDGLARHSNGICKIPLGHSILDPGHFGDFSYRLSFLIFIALLYYGLFCNIYLAFCKNIFTKPSSQVSLVPLLLLEMTGKLYDSPHPNPAPNMTGDKPSDGRWVPSPD